MALNFKETNSYYPFIHFSFVKSQKLFHVLTHDLGKSHIVLHFCKSF